MGKAASIGGWIVAVGLLAATAYLYRVNQDLDARLSASNAEREGILAQVQEQSEQNVELSEMIAKLSQGLEATQARLEYLEEATRYITQRRTGFSSFEALGDGVGQALGDLGAIIDFIASGRALIGGEGFVGLMQGLLTEDAPEAIARTTVDLKYGDFIRSLGLDEARQAEVEAAFIQGMRAQIEQVSSAFFGDEADEEERADVETDVLREHLAQVLTPEELELFDASQSDVRTRNIRRTFAVQLRLFAGGLTPENRDRVLDVFVEETLKAIDEDGMAPPDSFDIRGQLNTGRAVYPRALERLRGDLDDEQYAIVERFVDNQLRLLETSSKWLEGLFGEQVPEDEPR